MKVCYTANSIFCDQSPATEACIGHGKAAALMFCTGLVILQPTTPFCAVQGSRMLQWTCCYVPAKEAWQ